MPKEIKYLIGFSQIYLIGPTRFSKIKKSFSSLEEAWQAPQSALEKIGLEPKVIAEFLEKRKIIDLDRELERLAKAKVRVVALEDEAYPKLLKEIYLPPPLLYYRGQLPQRNDFLLAIVGTRKPSLYGRQVTSSLAAELANAGLIIVSGLALGVDALAHQAALKTEKGKTIAVLGSGVEERSVYPRANGQLAEKIITQGGCLISEHPLGTPALKQHFPRRNRLISGLSLGVLVTEAPVKSGALITARFSLEQNREVFSVPGNITNPASGGANNLIKMGAHAVSEANDILDALNLRRATAYLAAAAITPDTAEEARLLPLLGREPIHIDELTRHTGLPMHLINATLTLMEMKGKVRHLGAMQYVLAR